MTLVSGHSATFIRTESVQQSPRVGTFPTIKGLDPIIWECRPSKGFTHHTRQNFIRRRERRWFKGGEETYSRRVQVQWLVLCSLYTWSMGEEMQEQGKETAPFKEGKRNS
jgi:hypothetical protein